MEDEEKEVGFNDEDSDGGGVGSTGGDSVEIHARWVEVTKRKTLGELDDGGIGDKGCDGEDSDGDGRRMCNTRVLEFHPLAIHGLSPSLACLWF